MGSTGYSLKKLFGATTPSWSPSPIRTITTRSVAAGFSGNSSSENSHVDEDSLMSFCDIALEYQDKSPVDSSKTGNSSSNDEVENFASSYSENDSLQCSVRYELRGHRAIKPKTAKEVKGPVSNAQNGKLIRKKKLTKKELYAQVDCTCGKPYNGRFMIQCDYCDVWYHGSCQKVTQAKCPEIFYCTFCRQK